MPKATPAPKAPRTYGRKSGSTPAASRRKRSPSSSSSASMASNDPLMLSRPSSSVATTTSTPITLKVFESTPSVPVSPRSPLANAERATKNLKNAAKPKPKPKPAPGPKPKIKAATPSPWDTPSPLRLTEDQEVAALPPATSEEAGRRNDWVKHRVILALLGNVKNFDWYDLANQISKEGSIGSPTTSKGGKKGEKIKATGKGKGTGEENAEAVLSGTDLREMYHNSILPQLRAGTGLNLAPLTSLTPRSTPLSTSSNYSPAFQQATPVTPATVTSTRSKRKAEAEEVSNVDFAEKEEEGSKVNAGGKKRFGKAAKGRQGYKEAEEREEMI